MVIFGGQKQGPEPSDRINSREQLQVIEPLQDRMFHFEEDLSAGISTINRSMVLIPAEMGNRGCFILTQTLAEVCMGLAE